MTSLFGNLYYQFEIYSGFILHVNILSDIISDCFQQSLFHIYGLDSVSI